MSVMVDYVREVTVKKTCKYGEYGSFEHLLFLLHLVKGCKYWLLIQTKLELGKWNA